MPYSFNPFTSKLDQTGASGVTTETGTENPASGTTGELFYNTTDSTLYIYIGGIWVSVGSTDPHTGADFITEDGFYLLQEDGTSSLLLEA